MDCPIDDVLEALATEPPAVELGIGVSPPPPALGKTWFGTPAGDTHETDNFGLVWAPGQADATQAQQVGDALEAAWSTLVTDEQWVHPPLSEAYLVWVVLDPYLGTTGSTVLVDAPEAPDGYTVISIDPTLYGDDLELAAAHELMHAIQFRLREPPKDDAEAWYWEATAVWASTVVVGGSSWIDEAQPYLDAPGTRYDSTEDGHDRSMFVLDAWLEQSFGGGTVQDIWDEGRWQPDVEWPAIMETALGVSEQELFTEFAVDMSRDVLGFGAVAIEADLLSGVSGTLDRYGSHHYRNLGNQAVIAEIDAGLSNVWVGSRHGVGDEVLVNPGDALVVVGLADSPVLYQVFLRPAEATGTEPAPPRARTDPSEEAISSRGCGCDTGVPTGLWAPILLFIGFRRRR